jgi:hypothetical protein
VERKPHFVKMEKNAMASSSFFNDAQVLDNLRLSFIEILESIQQERIREEQDTEKIAGREAWNDYLNRADVEADRSGNVGECRQFNRATGSTD